MPNCRNCNSRIDKFNKDRCPICGIEHPFEGVNSDTVEITTNIDTSSLGIEYHPRKRKVAFIYSIIGGIIGLPFFYIYRKNYGVISLIISVIFLALGISLTCVLSSINPGLVILIYLGSAIIVHALIGLYFLYKPNLKDGHGDFLE